MPHNTLSVGYNANFTSQTLHNTNYYNSNLHALVLNYSATLFDVHTFVHIDESVIGAQSDPTLTSKDTYALSQGRYFLGAAQTIKPNLDVGVSLMYDTTGYFVSTARNYFEGKSVPNYRYNITTLNVAANYAYDRFILNAGIDIGYYDSSAVVGTLRSELFAGASFEYAGFLLQTHLRYGQNRIQNGTSNEALHYIPRFWLMHSQLSQKIDTTRVGIAYMHRTQSPYETQERIDERYELFGLLEPKALKQYGTLRIDIGVQNGTEFSMLKTSSIDFGVGLQHEFGD
jgi:hypothetical protein